MHHSGLRRRGPLSDCWELPKPVVSLGQFATPSRGAFHPLGSPPPRSRSITRLPVRHPSPHLGVDGGGWGSPVRKVAVRGSAGWASAPPAGTGPAQRPPVVVHLDGRPRADHALPAGLPQHGHPLPVSEQLGLPGAQGAVVGRTRGWLGQGSTCVQSGSVHKGFGRGRFRFGTGRSASVAPGWAGPSPSPAAATRGRRGGGSDSAAIPPPDRGPPVSPSLAPDHCRSPATRSLTTPVIFSGVSGRPWGAPFRPNRARSSASGSSGWS